MTNEKQFHPENTIPTADWIFVFGSTEGGKHSKGAAKVARVNFRASYGCDNGPTANAYAILSQDKQQKPTSIDLLSQSINDFIEYAKSKPKIKFFVTRIGFQEGYTDESIGSLFQEAPVNCSLPDAWKDYAN